MTTVERLVHAAQESGLYYLDDIKRYVEKTIQTSELEIYDILAAQDTSRPNLADQLVLLD